METTDKTLVKKWAKLIEAKDSRTAKPVKDVDGMAQLLENQEAWLLSEASSTSLADISQFTPILVPAVRRILPNLLANEIVGTQPLSGPTGYAYALRYAYEGAKGKININGANNGVLNYPGSAASGSPLSGASRVQKNVFGFGGIALVLSGSVAATVGGNFVITGGSGAGTYGKIALVQTDGGQGVTKVLIDLDTTTYPTGSIAVYAALDASGVTAVTLGSTSITLSGNPIIGRFNNEAGYNLIFGTAYTPYDETAAAEYQTRDQMKSMKMGIERFAVEAQTRKLKAEYSIELAQDLKNVHGLDAEAELINIIEYEIAAELDRDLVDAIHANSTPAGNWYYGPVGQIQVASTGSTAITTPVQTSDGRWEMEKFRSLYTRIVREANAVAISTRRGAANFIIASLNVVSALETLSNFMYSQVPGNVEPQFGVAKVGTLDGRFTVYLDTFAFTDFFIVGYKGTSAMDTGIVYCPYVPLQIQKLTDPSTFQPIIGFMTRDAICGNLFGSEKYYRKVACDFTGSSFISGQYFTAA